jgi:methyl-accepting chemotaxis protein
MTNQMTGPAENIENDVNALCDGTATNRSEVVDDIVANGKAIAELLDNLINTSDEEMRKEVEHD